ncbi:MAG: hypothetical protein PVG87_24490 [Desulfobacteraceae bacterium]
MIRRLKFWFKRGPEVTRAREVALQACIEEHPTDRPAFTELRALENDRFVVAVLIEPRYPHRGMPQYRLYSVSRDYSNVEELPRNPDSPYVFSWHKIGKIRRSRVALLRESTLTKGCS